MTSDDKARRLDVLIEAYQEARMERERLGDPLARPGKRKNGSGTVAGFLLSEAGRASLKAAETAVKAERNALKALRKFATKLAKHAVPRPDETKPASPAAAKRARPAGSAARP